MLDEHFVRKRSSKARDCGNGEAVNNSFFQVTGKTLICTSRSYKTNQFPAHKERHTITVTIRSGLVTIALFC